MMLVIQHAFATESVAYVDLESARSRLLLVTREPTTVHWRHRYHVAVSRFIACARNLESVVYRTERYLQIARRVRRGI